MLGGYCCLSFATLEPVQTPLRWPHGAVMNATKLSFDLSMLFNAPICFP